MRTLALTNFKGGTGKTTVAHNLAAALAIVHKRVLAIDLDMQANLSMSMGVNIAQLRPEETIFDYLLTDHADLNRYVKSIRRNLDLIPCTLDAELEMKLETEINKESLLATKLDEFSSDYDFIICDTPPALRAATVNALVAATDCYIVIDAGWYAMMGIPQLMRRLARIKKSFKKDNLVIRALINQYSKIQKMDNTIKSEVSEYFGDLLFRATIPRNTDLVKAAASQQSIFEYCEGAPSAFAFMQLAKEVLADEEAQGTTNTVRAERGE